MAKLLIVESPGKLKTLRKILGSGWILEASVGHTTELAHDGAKRLGFEIEGERVETRYVPRGDRGKQVLAKLRQAAKGCERVYLATDPDREGEAIAWHLVEQLKLKNYCRVSYTQITESAVRQAIQNPGQLDFSLIEAQRARQCLDKLVGFEVSPLLWNSTGGKSAGRVQSSTLHLICERERERLAFKPERYWVLRSIYGEGFEALYEPASPPGPRPAGEETPRVRTEDEARLILEVARTSPHVVSERETRDESRNAPPPFITSTLQQMAGARFRYSPKKTMEIAQELYEGIGGKGLITYMRTDSTNLSPEFVTEARHWISEHSPESLPERPPFIRPKSDAQAAHEAIRPTSAYLTPTEASKLLKRDQLNVYTLIWERAIASQCKSARLSRTKLVIECSTTRWVARGMTVLDPGYLKFWKNTEEEKTLPDVREGQRLDFREAKMEERVTEPPPRYTEPKLVQMMEKRGIGRPSTYASTIATLKDRDYVVLEKNFLAPTPLGMATDEALSKALPDLVNPDFTARMESALDEIAEGKRGWEKYLSQWSREYLEPALESARKLLLGTARVATYSPRRGTSGDGAGRGAGAPKSRAARGSRARSDSRDGGRAGLKAGAGRRTAEGSRGSCGTARATRSMDGASIERELAKARRAGALPICPSGHGALSLRTSQKGGYYWKCAHSGCEAFAWHQQFSSESCPDCSQPLEKVPSSKVTGGYFLKCARKDRHPSEVVLFRDRMTKKWERARSRD